jgi:hypothetical protein
MQQLALQLAPLVPGATPAELGALLVSLDERLGPPPADPPPGSPLVQLLLRVSERIDEDASALQRAHPAVKLDAALSTPAAPFRRFCANGELSDERVLGLFTLKPQVLDLGAGLVWPDHLADETVERVRAVAEQRRLGMEGGSHVWVRNLRPMRLPGGEGRGYLLAAFKTDGFRALAQEDEENGEEDDEMLEFYSPNNELLAIPEDAAQPVRVHPAMQERLEAAGMYEMIVEAREEDGTPSEVSVNTMPYPVDGQELFYNAWFQAAVLVFAAE